MNEKGKLGRNMTKENVLGTGPLVLNARNYYMDTIFKTGFAMVIN